jgi:hypothetical protein
MDSRKYIWLVILTLSLTKATAQDTTQRRIQEVYLSATDFSPLQLQIKYKTQLHKKTFLKVGLIDLGYFNNYNSSASPNGSSSRNINYSAGVLLGLEFRNNLYKKFAFYHGPNLNLSVNSYVTRITAPFLPTQTRTTTTYSAGIPYTLGVLFHLKSNFYLSAEINPGIQYTRLGSYNYYDNISFTFNNSGLLSLVYRL